MFKFTPAGHFTTFRDKSRTRAFIIAAAKLAKKIYIDGMNAPKSGRVYTSKGKTWQASAPGEYPANRTNAYKGSISARTQAMRMTIGAEVPYAVYLADGTKRIKERKSSRHALQEALPETREELRGFIRWKAA